MAADRMVAPLPGCDAGSDSCRWHSRLFADARRRSRTLRLGARSRCASRARRRRRICGERRCVAAAAQRQRAVPAAAAGLHTGTTKWISACSASYTFDWWGKQRAAVDGSRRQRPRGPGRPQRRRAGAGQFGRRHLFRLAGGRAAPGARARAPRGRRAAAPDRRRPAARRHRGARGRAPRRPGQRRELREDRDPRGFGAAARGDACRIGRRRPAGAAAAERRAAAGGGDDAAG